MISRRRLIAGGAAGLLVLHRGSAAAQEGMLLTAEQAARQLFPEASGSAERTIEGSAALREQIRGHLERPPSMWEPSYRVFTARRDAAVLGYVVVVEEIGKHRPITYAVAIEPGGAVHDVAVLAYREPYGGEVKERRFLKQYAGRTATAPLQPYRDIQNIAGATLSVQATGRAVKKAIAVLRAVGEVR